MKHAETVTFGGSGLDRAAHLRATADTLWPSARVLPVWRGKVAVCEPARLGMLTADHPLCRDQQPRAIFLGLDEGVPVFAFELTGWDGPPDAPEPGGFLDTTLQVHPDQPDGHGFGELRAFMNDLTPREAELAATSLALINWHRNHGFCARCGAPSQMASAGWERHCGTCSAPHFPRTDPVVIMLIEDDNRILLGRSPGWPEGMYSLPAGFVEPGEPIEAAVRREILEETGVTVGAVEYLASQPWPYPSSLMFGCRGVATSRQITLDPNELEDALWISREELAQAMLGQHVKVKPARAGSIAHFIMTNWLADRLD